MSFYPFNSPRANRATELAKEFARQGHKVKVITRNEGDVETFCKEHKIEFKNLGKLTWPAPKIKGSGVTRFFWRILVRFSALLFEYPMLQLSFLAKKALLQENNYDLLISIAVPYPIHWGVASARKKNHSIAKIWVADCGDPYMKQENDTFTPPFYFAWIEKWFCRKADYISVPTKNSYKGYFKEFHSKIKVIPQGFRFEDTITYKGEKNTKKVIFGYGGAFIQGRRDPTEFLHFLNCLEESYDFEFHIYTNSIHLVQPFIEASKGRIILKDVVNRSTLLYELSKMDFVVNFENRGTAQTPSKLIDYVIINKPILSIPTEQFQKITFFEFYQNDYSNAMVIKNIDQYKISNIVMDFLKLLQ